MIIKNLTKKKEISKDAEICSSVLSKFIGLMFSAEPKALVFRFDKEQNISLHMLFVFYPIDVLFLDNKKIVVDMKEDFRPFTFYKSRKKAMYAVEFPTGAIRKSKAMIGDKLLF